MLKEWLDGGPTQGKHENSASQEYAIGDDRTTPQARSSNFTKSEHIENNCIGKNCHYATSMIDVKSPGGNSQSGLQDAVPKGHIEMVKILLEGGASANKLDARGLNSKAIAENQGNKAGNKQKMIGREHRIDLNELEVVSTWMNDQNKTRSHRGTDYFEPLPGKPPSVFESNHRRFCTDQESAKKRVTIHMRVPTGKTQTRHLAKLIVLPDSIEELLRVAGKLYLMCNEF